ncbi:dihydrodipicolinate synthase family protein [Verminephrobacter eiseniae]|uniref:dihydrodipicolinate synthase family protein n=1 Tax=Verminephrobacter eiseniae TaxID=364317 RepID=UPI00223745C5|nr:dihydrodipicolinate synthase family protein [Verminephrobacter eiseniae]MCW5232080.1 dihydrodipicolinate synthase family protein [Verminephrobacter eiseniae]MCW5258776.1 dihydrodipicolinate synthase family protein [Verminephrobacter eiseniae]MCW8232949.1 dihydrodipicolinate synthase family protein [Verminephrobacter eiseniae]
MHRNTVDWAGYIPAITTPFTRSGALDWAALDAQLQWYLQERMHGVVLAGTSGEWFSLSAAERAELFAQAGRMIAGRITVLGGCNAYTAAEAIGHARAAERAGLDGILLTPPPYIVPSRRELVQFYTDVSDATDIPICIYNWPRGCVVDMDVELLEELAEIDHVVAIKNSTGNFALFLQGAYALRDKVRYFNMPTTELGADLARLGVSDGLMGAGGVLGADHPDFWRLLAAGDKAGALVLGERDRVLMKAWFNQDFAGRFGSAQAILKTALRLRGVPAGHVRRPLLELTADDVAQVRATLEGLGIATAALAGA